jgi:hypothetical protein
VLDRHHNRLDRSSDDRSYRSRRLRYKQAHTHLVTHRCGGVALSRSRPDNSQRRRQQCNYAANFDACRQDIVLLLDYRYNESFPGIVSC